MMRKLIACMLALCLSAAPVLACAQSIATEELLGQILMDLAEQLQEPSFAMRIEEGKDVFGACFALDDQGMPDLAISAQSGNQAVSVDADAAGLRFDDGSQRIAVSFETLLKALASDENGVSYIPDLREEDVMLLAQIISEMITAAAPAVSVERIVQEFPQEDGEAEEQTYIIRTIVSMNALLAALDTAIPAALEAHGDELNALLARNSEMLTGTPGGSDLPDLRELARMWPEGLLAGMIPEEKPLAVVMEEQAENWKIKVIFEGFAIAQVYGEPGRIYGAFGPSGEYAFDSDDLKTIAGIIAQLPAYISREALCAEYQDEDGLISARLKLDMQRLAEDITAGCGYIVQRSRGEIEALLARYMPWCAYFGAYGAEDITWQMLYATLRWDQSFMARDMFSSVRGIIRQNGLLRALFGDSLPEIEANCTIDPRNAGGRLSVSLNQASFNMTFSAGQIMCSLKYIRDRMMPEEIRLSGSWNAQGLQGSLIQFSGSRQTLICRLEGARGESDYTLRLYDEEGTELAQAVIEPKVVEGKPGFGCVVTGHVAEEPLSVQMYVQEGMGHLLASLAGAEVNAQWTDRKNASEISLSVRPAAYAPEYRFVCRTKGHACSLTAESAYRGRLLTGAELEAEWSDASGYIRGKIVKGGIVFQGVYRPGELSLSREGSNGMYGKKLHIADVTGTGVPGNVTRIEMADERNDGFRRNANVWTVETQKEGDLYTVTIRGERGIPVMLTLDFAASPQAQDLSGYTWMTPQEVRGWIDELTATPEPTAAPTPELTPEVRVWIEEEIVTPEPMGN